MSNLKKETLYSCKVSEEGEGESERAAAPLLVGQLCEYSGGGGDCLFVCLLNPLTHSLWMDG